MNHSDSSPPATSASKPFSFHRVAARTGSDSLYALVAFPLSLVAFIIAITGVATGLSTIIIWIGLPILTGTVLAARGLAQLERRRLRTFGWREAPPTAYLAPERGSSVIRKVLTPLRDAQSWLDVVWSVLSFITGTFAFTLIVSWWSLALAGLTYWFWQRWIPHPDDTWTLAQLLGFGTGRAAEIFFYAVVGVVATLTLPLVARAAAVPHAALSSALLNSRASLQSEVQRVVDSRGAAQEAEAASLRRLERDIHDGPQQRLVRLTMDLGRARKQVVEDPPSALPTVDAALTQAREIIDELRALSRGIAPPLLVDRGLAVAVRELVARTEIPVSLTVDVPAALPPHVETAVYFTVAEALTNVAKHSGAERVQISVCMHDGSIEARVTDDGVGGAHVSKGSGLAGLQQRLHGVEGTLEVTSPQGGPTTVAARIPVA